jgi:hypothetical protein
MAAKKTIDVGTLLQAIATAAGIEVPTAEEPVKAKPPPAKAKRPRPPRRPPLEAEAPVAVVGDRKRVDPKTVPAELRNKFSTCPQCGHTGPIGTDFGVRVHRGILRKQSWCADCRAKTNYHARPRKYQTQQ